jgi:hypothetical protein
MTSPTLLNGRASWRAHSFVTRRVLQHSASLSRGTLRSLCLALLICLVSLQVWGAEKKFSFADVPENQAPTGWRSTVTGEGKPGEWKVILDEVPPLLEPLTPQAAAVTRRSVLAQLSRDPTDERFPLLIYEDEVFGDFTLTTRFKTVDGVAERMAGIAFRIQNETNYYVVRASSLGSTFRFYKVVNGKRGTIIGPSVPIPSGVWHELTVECKGNQIRCLLNGQEAVPALFDSSFSRGKIGFWTKSDSVSYFTDTRIVYTPLEVPAQKIVREVGARYERLRDLKVFVGGKDAQPVRLVGNLAETAEEDATEAIKTDTELKTLSSGKMFYGKTRKSVTVVMPLRDRNGDVIAAVRVVMATFPGQTEQNAIARATPIVRAIQSRAQTLEDLVD